jgi:hypothetical protein
MILGGLPMTITLNLSPEQEQRLRMGADHQDVQAVREVLLQAVDSTVQELLNSSARKDKTRDLSALLDQIASVFKNAPVLPDEALTREGIYGDHL